MKLKAFIQQHRLRQKLDDCGDLNAIGRRGTIYAWDDSALAVTVLGGSSTYWNLHRRLLSAAGCSITQNGDTEGTATFDPQHSIQVSAALDAIKAYRKRKVTPELLAQLERARVGSTPFVRKTQSDASDAS